MEDMAPLSKSRLFRGLSSEEINKLLPLFKAGKESFLKGETILRAGERTDRLGILLSGSALIIQEDWWGNRNIISELIPPNSFGESFACVKGSVLTVSVRAEEDSEVLFLSMDAFLAPSGLREHETVLRNFITDLSMKNLRFSEKLRHLGGRSTRAKLLSYLSAEAEKNGSDEFDIPFSRQELADYLFVERSGLSTELSKMKKEGLIESEKNHFVLLRQQ